MENYVQHLFQRQIFTIESQKLISILSYINIYVWVWLCWNISISFYFHILFIFLNLNWSATKLNSLEILQDDAPLPLITYTPPGQTPYPEFEVCLTCLLKGTNHPPLKYPKPIQSTLKCASLTSWCSMILLVKSGLRPPVCSLQSGCSPLHPPGSSSTEPLPSPAVFHHLPGHPLVWGHESLHKPHTQLWC